MLSESYGSLARFDSTEGFIADAVILLKHVLEYQFWSSRPMPG